MDKKLDVFLSSSVAEFKSERKHLSKKISEISFLECKLLEDRGPQAQSVELTSLSEVSKCDILVGINCLGHCDSEITRAEIGNQRGLQEKKILFDLSTIRNKK